MLLMLLLSTDGIASPPFPATGIMPSCQLSRVDGVAERAERGDPECLAPIDAIPQWLPRGTPRIRNPFAGQEYAGYRKLLVRDDARAFTVVRVCQLTEL